MLPGRGGGGGGSAATTGGVTVFLAGVVEDPVFLAAAGSGFVVVGPGDAVGTTGAGCAAAGSGLAGRASLVATGLVAVSGDGRVITYPPIAASNTTTAAAAPITYVVEPDAAPSCWRGGACSVLSRAAP